MLIVVPDTAIKVFALFQEESNMLHNINGQSAQLIYRLTRRHGPEFVRFWFDAYGHLTGVWQGHNRQTYAIVQSLRQANTCTVYHADGTDDNWPVRHPRTID